MFKMTIESAVKKLRSVPMLGWHAVKIFGQEVWVSRMAEDLACEYKASEVWARIGKGWSSYDLEFRGTAERVAYLLSEEPSLARNVRRDSDMKTNTIKATKAVILCNWYKKFIGSDTGIDGMKAYEIAAWLNLDTDLTFRAVASLVKEGDLVDRGDRGVFRTTRGAVNASTGLAW